MRLSRPVSNRIAMLRPILIMGVVVVHVDGLSDMPSEIDLKFFDIVAAFFKNSVFRATVPTMSLIAGYLLFTAKLDGNLPALFRKKFSTLLIPFVIFNVYALCFMATVNTAFGPVFPRLGDLQQSPGRLLVALFGLKDYPLNGPLHFVRDMLVAILLVPLFSLFLRNAPWIGLVVLGIFFGTDMDGVLIFRASSLILFYIGGAAAVYRWNVLALDKYALECLSIFIAACLVVTGFGIDDRTLLIMTAPFLIWPAASLLADTKMETSCLRLSKYSFFIFAAHMPILNISWWIVKCHAAWIPYPVYWILAPALVIIGLIYFYEVAMRVAPAAFNFAIGARASNSRRIDRRSAVRPADAPVYSPEMRLRLKNR